MKLELKHTGKMKLETKVGGFNVAMDADAPIGDGSSASPKQMLLVGMAGCTAMDVISLLRKHKQGFENFSMQVNAEAVKTYPQVFNECMMEYYAEGAVDARVLNESVQLSLSKYCSVNAMVSKVVPIKWRTYINSQLVGEGKAEFNF